MNGSARVERSTEPGETRTVAPNLAIGDLVVYGAHGIGRVETRGAAEADRSEVVGLAFENGLRVTLALAHARSALRSLCGERDLRDVRRTLRSHGAPAVGPWAKRLRCARDKVTVGHVTGLAEVVRDGLQEERRALARARTRARSSSERQLYLRARKLLADEIAVVRGVDAVQADTWIVAQVGERAEE